MKPVAPVTSVFAIGGDGSERSEAAAVACAGALIQVLRMSPAAETAIVCDTTSYLPDEMISSRGIQRVSLYVALGGEQRRESEITDYDGFFERLRASDEGATTSQPSVGDFIAVYQPLLEAGREIVSIHLSAEISGTYEAAAAGAPAARRRGRRRRARSTSSTAAPAAAGWGC